MEPDRLILDLCGGTGSWSRPYMEHGYTVVVIDPWVNGLSVVGFSTKAEVHGILAAPPCTDFSSSGAQFWTVKDHDGRTAKSVLVVLECLRIIKECRPKWWCLENPVGRLPKFIGQPVASFDPCEFGDPWTKKTCLWGSFNFPKRSRVYPTVSMSRHNSPERYGEKLGISRARARAVTPCGFARAFFEANP